MKTKTTCKKTIIVRRKELLEKLGLSGKIEDIEINKTYKGFNWVGVDDGLKITVLVSEEEE